MTARSMQHTKWSISLKSEAVYNPSTAIQTAPQGQRKEVCADETVWDYSQTDELTATVAKRADYFKNQVCLQVNINVNVTRVKMLVN
jgi:hypothetical protein